MAKDKGAASSPSNTGGGKLVMLSNNTEIWDKLEKTNPKYTKAFKKAGGNSGTSINPTYVYKKLTEQFGPCGIGWGYEELSSEYVNGNTIKDTTEKQIIHVVKINLWHGSKENTVMGVGTTTFVGSNKYGLFTDEEYYKKSVTDALTNAAKMIGCSADIFMGLYDDNKYINQITAEFNKPVAPPKPKSSKSIKVQTLEFIGIVKVKGDWAKIKKQMIQIQELKENWDEVTAILGEAYKNWTKSQSIPPAAPPPNTEPMTETEKAEAQQALAAESATGLNEDETNDRRMNG